MTSCKNGHENPVGSRFCGQCGEALTLGAVKSSDTAEAAAPLAGVAAAEQTGGGRWLPDPTGRHEYRYLTPSGWSEHVSDGGAVSRDPHAAAPPPPEVTMQAPPAAVVADTGTGTPSRSPRVWYRRPVVVGLAAVAVVVGLAAAVAAIGNANDEKASPRVFRSKTAGSTSTSTSSSTTTTTTIPPALLLQEIQAKVGELCPQVASGSIAAQDAANRAIAGNEVRWNGLTDAGALAIQIGTCAQAQNDAELAGAQPVNVDAIVKDPDAFNGQVFIMVTEITQYDAATGACSFRGYWDTREHEYTFEYAGDNAIFSSGDGASNCPVLAGVDQNDVVRVWVRSEGSYSYDTQIGGNTTAPKFKVLKAEIIRKK